MKQENLPIPFPQDLVQAKLNEYWDEQIKSSAETDSIFPLGENMDSLTACIALIEIETILNIEELPQTLIQQGGYKSKKEFSEQLTLSVRNHLSEE